MSDHRTFGYTIAVLAGLSFGALPIISALSRDLGASSIEQAFLRIFISSLAGIVVVIFFYSRNSSEFSLSIDFSAQKTYFLQGLLLVINIFLYLSSIALRTPVGEAALLVQVHPFVTLIFGYFLLGEKITRTKIGSLFLAITGLLIITSPWEWDSFLTSLPGDFLAVLNGFFYSVYLLVGRWGTKYRKNVSSGLSISWVLIWAMIAYLPVYAFLTFLPLPGELIAFSFETVLSPDILLLGIFLALFGSIIPYGLIMVSSSVIESSTQSLLLLDEPIGVIILGWLILGEPITIPYIIGGIALISSIIIIFTSNSRNDDISTTVNE
ncbi:MAG: DMT family transporter [Candidatus Hodarchaeales archaeon]